MFYLAWGSGLALLAFLAWLLGAFVLRLGHAARLMLTLIVPAATAGCCLWSRYMIHRIGDPGWDAVFVVVSVTVAALVAIAALPVWFLAEEKLGWRAR